MKKFFSLVAFFTLSLAGFAQDVDNFEVGPYEVDYKGPGNYKARLRKGVNLYEYFDLKKDTTIVMASPEPSLLKHGVQVTVNGEVCLCNTNSSVYGISGSWKQAVSNFVYLNGGLSLGFGFANSSGQKYRMMEIGVPLSVEFGKIRKRKGSLYGGVGLVPTVYTTLSAKYNPEIEGNEPEKYTGVYLAPQIDFGGYIPAGNLLVRIGVSWRYKINCSTKDGDLYKTLLGRSFGGVNVGLIF